MKKNVLCFGDSNTWGAVPCGERFGEAVRWPKRMASLLGDGYYVIEEGFNGRTCLIDDPVEGGYKSGAAYLPPCLMSHNPLDLVIIMLGTNDTKSRFSLNAFTIAQGAAELVKLALQYSEHTPGKPAKVLLVSPITIGENVMETTMGPIFGAQSIAVSKGFAEEYRKMALLHHVEFLDAAQYASASPLDAIHMGSESQLALAAAMADKVRAILE